MSRPAQTKTGQFSGGRDRDSPSMIRILYGYTENGKMSSGMGPCPHGEMTAAAGDGPVKTGPSFFALLPKNDCNKESSAEV